MKRYLTIFYALCALVCTVSGQSLFEEGNRLYAEGQYAEAADAYRGQLELTPCADLYYNLGNACFRQGELAQAILAYERALRLNPRDEDIRYNLQFARTQITDNLEDNDPFVVRWAVGLRNSMSEHVWSMLSIVTFWLMLVAALLFAFVRMLWLRKTAFYTAVLCLLVSACAFGNAASLRTRDAIRAEAIITQGVVNAKASPDKSGTDLFTLHEGTKVTIDETLGDWVSIRVGSYVGWVQLAHLERI